YEAQVKTPCARPVNTRSPGTRYAFLRHALLSAGQAASLSAPFTKLTCGRADIREATRGRLMSKSTPRQTFGSESASAGKENETMHPSTSIWLKTTICPRPPMPFMAKFPQSPRQFDRASVFRGKFLA